MNTKNVMNAIAALDLEPVKTKLMHVASGEGWSRARVEALDVEYRRFLYLTHAFSNEAVAPSVDVDTFWHYHILDTVKYAADCASTFGYFLHHNPNVGLDSAPEAGDEERGGQRMREIYERTFGQAYVGVDANLAAYCGTTPGLVGAANAQLAYCGTTPGLVGAATAQLAYCGTTPGLQDKAKRQAAYCGVAPGLQRAANQAAYCGVVPGLQRAVNQAAYCGVVPGLQSAVNQAAYCGVVPGLQSAVNQAAYCGIVPGLQNAVNQAAYCGCVPTLKTAPESRAAAQAQAA